MKCLRFTNLLLLACLICFMSSCKKESKPGNFTLQIKAKYGDQSFALNTPNTDPQNRRIKVDALAFYLSHISLVKNDNSTVTLADAALINFSDPTSLSLNVNNIDGDFKGISFGTGLDSIQNETDPLTVSDDNPLSNNKGMYWPWLKYIFYKFEARCDTTGTGNGTYNWFPLYHIGTNSTYRTTSLNQSFSICCDKQYTLTLYLDVKKIFYGGTDTLDIISESTTQMGSTDDPAVATKFSDNFSKAFTF